MTVPENALPLEGSAKPAQNSMKIYETDRRDRLVLAGVLLWCLLSVDIIFWSWPWGMGLTAIVFAWYAVLAAALGPVSYTHLDVYKRQASYIPRLSRVQPHWANTRAIQLTAA